MARSARPGGAILARTWIFFCPPRWPPSLRSGSHPRPCGGGLSARPAHRDAVEPQGGLADAHRYALAVLAAGADAFVERKIVADHGDAGERVGTVADQHRALDRRADLAVFQPIGLGALEHELARGDVDLPAAEAHGVDAVLHRGENLARFALAGEHVGVGHARHRDVREALAPSVSGRAHV